jgi:hypothetical protein
MSAIVRNAIRTEEPNRETRASRCYKNIYSLRQEDKKERDQLSVEISLSDRGDNLDRCSNEFQLQLRSEYAELKLG